MKKIPLLIALAFATSVFAAEAPTTTNEKEASGTDGERRAPERAELKVLKIFFAQDGEAIFRAYMVEWKGQEVVVTDTLAKTDYKVGDMMSVLVMNQPFPQGRERYRLLHFAVMPPFVRK